MNKLIGIILITIALAACEPIPQAGTGGYDPETQNLLAIATQTGAAVLIAQTASAQQATARSIYAEQTAVSAYATATKQTSDNATMQAQAQATAVSATETAVHLPVSVQQTREKQALVMERENAASTATAVAISAEIAANAKAVQRWDKFWNGFFIFLGGLGGALVIGLTGQAFKQWKSAEFVEDGNGNVIAIDRRLMETQHARRAVIVQNPEYTPPQIEAPVNNMKATTDTRTVSGSRNGRPHDWTLPEENPVKDETWQKLAVALLVCGVDFSREAVLDRTKRNWVYGRMSQPEYNAAYAFMAKRGLVGGKMGGDKMTGALYEFLEDYVPSHEEIALPHPDEAEIIDTR